MISKLGAIAFIAAIGLAPMGLASPASAAGPYGPQYNGGGSAGYNHHIATDYRLKHHKSAKHQAQQPSKAQ